MIVSHKYKLIFIHIGKTGGDAISFKLKSFLELDKGDIFVEQKEKTDAHPSHPQQIAANMKTFFHDAV